MEINSRLNNPIVPGQSAKIAAAIGNGVEVTPLALFNLVGLSAIAKMPHSLQANAEAFQAHPHSNIFPAQSTPGSQAARALVVTDRCGAEAQKWALLRNGAFGKRIAVMVSNNAKALIKSEWKNGMRFLGFRLVAKPDIAPIFE
ncbi:MAG: hypothetical protein WBE76_28700 [Terracidiphilus sp.]